MDEKVTSALLEAIRQEIIRQSKEDSVAWLHEEAYQEGEICVQMSGLLNLHDVARAVLAALADDKVNNI